MPEEEIKTRTDQDIAALLYGKPKEAGSVEPQEPEKPPEPRVIRSLADIADVVYPSRPEQFQDIGEDGQAREDIIRDTEGLILHRGKYHGDVKPLVQYNARRLNNAVLTNLDFHKEMDGARMQAADLRGSSFVELRNSDLQGADLRGATFKSLYGSDLRGVKMDATTDLTNCDLTEAKYSLSEVKKAKGWRTCKGLKMGADK